MKLNHRGFEASDIEKITGINRPRLQQWLEKGFIAPSIQIASGPGTRNVYSIDNVYQIAAIKKMIEFGFSREKAAQIVNGRVVNMDGPHIIFMVHNFEGAGTIISKSAKDDNDLQGFFNAIKEMVMSKGGAYILNYTKLMEEIDQTIKKIS